MVCSSLVVGGWWLVGGRWLVVGGFLNRLCLFSSHLKKISNHSVLRHGDRGGAYCVCGNACSRSATRCGPAAGPGAVRSTAAGGCGCFAAGERCAGFNLSVFLPAFIVLCRGACVFLFVVFLFFAEVRVAVGLSLQPSRSMCVWTCLAARGGCWWP